MALLLALLGAFDLALLLEHFIGRLLARTSSGTDVVVKSTLGHGAIRSFDHLGFHGLLNDLALGGGLSSTLLVCTDIRPTGGCGGIWEWRWRTSNVLPYDIILHFFNSILSPTRWIF